jgi:2-methylcitrate dehydratase PrpD
VLRRETSAGTLALQAQSGRKAAAAALRHRGLPLTSRPRLSRRGLLGSAIGTAVVTPVLAQAQAQAPPGRLLPAVTRPLSAFIAGAAEADWPGDIFELARRHVLDTLASIVACHDLEPAKVARRYALGQTGGIARGSAIFGSREKAALIDAVFANAMTGHAAEINDYSPSAFVQPGPSVVSVSLALAGARQRSGKAFLRAVITGYEVACRMPKALGNGNLRRAGIANHGIGPTFGCAAAAASLLGLPQARISDVLSLATEQASGSWQWLLDTDHIEKAFVFAGMGARNGLQTALMVEAGFTGVPDNLDRAGGWLDTATFTGPQSDLNRAYLIEGLGTRFELPLVGYKLYAAGGPTQAGVHGLLQLIRQVDRAQIEQVLIAMPGFDVSAFRDAAIPALNLPYMSALILAEGRLDFQAVQSRERMRNDPNIRALMARIEMVADPTQDRSPRVESARVTVTLKGGATRSVFVESVPGFPTNPLSAAEVEAKAMELLVPRMGHVGARRLVEQVGSLESAANVDRLIATLTA